MSYCIFFSYLSVYLSVYLFLLLSIYNFFFVISLTSQVFLSYNGQFFFLEIGSVKHFAPASSKINNSGGNTLRPGGYTLCPGGSTLRPGGSTLRPGGNTLRPGGSTLRPGGNTLRPGGNTLRPAGNYSLNPNSIGGGVAIYTIRRKKFQVNTALIKQISQMDTALVMTNSSSFNLK